MKTKEVTAPKIFHNNHNTSGIQCEHKVWNKIPSSVM
jgi:hypothetical protein